MSTVFIISAILVLSSSTLMYAQNENSASNTTPIPMSAEEIRPLLVGGRIPKVNLTTSSGSPFDLNEAVSQKPSIVIFYRGGWCPYCNVHLGQIQSVEPELLSLGYQILAISSDRPAKLRESIERKHLNYCLLSDSTMACAREFGIVFQVDEKTVERYKRNSMDLEEASGLKHHLLPVPAAFIIGADGVIKFEYVNPNYKVRIDPDVLLAAARAALK